MYDDEATLLEEATDGVKADPYVPSSPLGILRSLPAHDLHAMFYNKKADITGHA